MLHSGATPDICHQYICGENSVMWRDFRFQYLTDVKKSEISTHVENFRFFHTTGVEKCEILPNLEVFHVSPHMTDVKKSESYPVFGVKSVLWQFMLFFCKICFGAI